jgi:hypothetical protein
MNASETSARETTIATLRFVVVACSVVVPGEGGAPVLKKLIGAGKVVRSRTI